MVLQPDLGMFDRLQWDERAGGTVSLEEAGERGIGNDDPLWVHFELQLERGRKGGVPAHESQSTPSALSLAQLIFNSLITARTPGAAQAIPCAASRSCQEFTVPRKVTVAPSTLMSMCFTSRST